MIYFFGKAVLLSSAIWLVVSGFYHNTNSVGMVQLFIVPQVNDLPLVLTQKGYATPGGDSTYIDVLRFYISRVQLKNKNGALFQEKDSYHLFDAEEDGHRIFTVDKVPVGTYDSLFFCVGTDSLTNISGVMGGDLDPLKGMYWTWNSGYINIKLEGRSALCKTKTNRFEFHVGGYMPPNTTVRRVALPIKKVKIRANKSTNLPVIADLGRFFGAIQLSQINLVMTPSPKAARVADDFKKIFRTSE